MNYLVEGNLSCALARMPCLKVFINRNQMRAFNFPLLIATLKPAQCCHATATGHGNYQTGV